MKKTVDESKEQSTPSTSGNPVAGNAYQSSQTINTGGSMTNGLIPPHYLSPILNTQPTLLRPLMTTAPLYSPILSSSVQHSIPLHHHPLSVSQVNSSDAYRNMAEIENLCNNSSYSDKPLSDKQCLTGSNAYHKQSFNELCNNFSYQGGADHSKGSFHEHRLIDEYVKMYGEDCSKFWQEAGLCPLSTQSPGSIKPGPSSANSNCFNSKADPSWNKAMSGGQDSHTSMTNKDGHQLNSTAAHNSSTETTNQRTIDYQSLSASQLSSILPYLQHYPYQLQDERSELKSNVVMCNANTSMQQSGDANFKKFGPCTFSEQEAANQTPANVKKCNDTSGKMNANGTILTPCPTSSLQTPTICNGTRDSHTSQARANAECSFHSTNITTTPGWSEQTRTQAKLLPKNINNNECKKKSSRQLERQQICFICNATLDINETGCIDSLMTVPSKISVSDKISIILGYPLPRDVMNNIAICPKCYHLVNEVDVLEHRLNLCRREVMSSLESSFERDGLPSGYYRKQQQQNNFGYPQHNDGQNVYCQGYVAGQQSHNHGNQPQYHAVDAVGNLMTTFSAAVAHSGYGDHNGQGFPTANMMTAGGIPLNEQQMSVVQLDNTLTAFHGSHLQDNHATCQQVSGGVNHNTSTNQHQPVMQAAMVNDNGQSVHMSTAHVHAPVHNHHGCPIQQQQTNAINYSNCKPFTQQQKSIQNIQSECAILNEQLIAPIGDKDAVMDVHLAQKPSASVNQTSAHSQAKYTCRQKHPKDDICLVETLPVNVATGRALGKATAQNLVQSLNGTFHSKVGGELSTNQSAVRYADRNQNYANCGHVNHGTAMTANLCCPGDNPSFNVKHTDAHGVTANGIYYNYSAQKLPINSAQNYGQGNFNNINYNVCSQPQKSDQQTHALNAHESLCAGHANTRTDGRAVAKILDNFTSQANAPSNVKAINNLPTLPVAKRENIDLHASYNGNAHTNQLPGRNVVANKPNKTHCTDGYQQHQPVGHQFTTGFDAVGNYQPGPNSKTDLNLVEKQQRNKTNETVDVSDSGVNSFDKRVGIESIHLPSKISLAEYEKRDKISSKNPILADSSVIVDLPDDASDTILQESFSAMVPGYASQHIFDTLSQYDEDVNIEEIAVKSGEAKDDKLCLPNDETWPDSAFIEREPHGRDDVTTSKGPLTEGDVDIEECDNLIDDIGSVESCHKSDDHLNETLLSVETSETTDAVVGVDNPDSEIDFPQPSATPSPDHAYLEQLMSPSSQPPTPAGPPEGLRNVQDATEYHKPTLLGKSIKTKKHAKLQICRQCDQVFSNRQALIRHIERRHKSSAHCCPTCNRKFNSEKMLHAHMEVHKGYQCDSCDQIFMRKSKLKRHTTLKHSKDHLTCTVCAKVTLSLQALISHAKTHAKKERSRFKCATCAKEFASHKNLKGHELIHSGELPFKCDNCDRSFRHRSNMTSHRKLCVGTSLFKCDLCPKKFPLKSLHTRHLLEHKGIYAHRCAVCDKGFGKSSDLRNHFGTHSTADEAVNRCKICLPNLPSACNLAFSKDTVGAECPICGKVVKRKDTMRDHVSQHEGKRNYVCVQCPAAFFYRQNLNNHVNTVHENKKPYACPSCAKSFAKSDTYKLHLRTHTGEKPFHCFCGKSFSCNSNFNRHKKYHKHETQ